MFKRIRLPLLLFLAFRLAMIAYWPADELAAPDYSYLHQLASWVDQGHWPYIDYWVEYPPLFPFLSVLIYLITSHYAGYATVLALILVVFEVGIMLLLYRLAARMMGEARAERIVWVYALLFAPIQAWWAGFDAITTFLLLLALDLWLATRRTQSALWLAVGGLIKWFPLLFLGPAVRFRRHWREAVLYTVLVLGIVAIVFGLFLAFSPTYTWASIRSLGGRTSWQTVWALIDGNFSTGAYHASRFDPDAAALLQGNPARVPTWLTTLLFGVLYLWLWLRMPDEATPARVVQFTTLTVVLFFLWSRGWSPQWLGLLAPLFLLSLPLERGVLYILVLTFINIAEWPVLLSRGMNQWLYLTVPLRTIILVMIAVALASRALGRPGENG